MMPSRANTVYYLELREHAAFRPIAAPAGFDVALVNPSDPQLNHTFYGAVGARWKWTDRLEWSDVDWARYVDRDNLRTLTGRLNGVDVGYGELESQNDGVVEIVYFGLLPEYIGQGWGGALLSGVVDYAWNVLNARRIWLHTCTDDHEHALANYQARGFQIYRTEREPHHEM
ncbi:MAG: GNAT family N-acetyltransferase [Verrucomicrobiae bacterium]|nr:GNAT family N-acetyltransferase [Verrucomicrobiae bacterium]NNJ86225.1 GNAT family N-acetyltransferase [Akkermansiaceae bacterium]